jgi:hypothetical protein
MRHNRTVCESGRRPGRPKVLHPARTTQALHPDRDHHRTRHRRPLPPGPALRLTGLARPLRDPAQHHRRPQRPHQRPRSRSPRPASPPPCPRHRRPVDLHRPAADGRQHPQDPRLAGPRRRRQGPHRPAGTPTASQPARLPPRRLTGTSSSPPDHLQPGGSAASQAGQQPHSRPAGPPRPGHTAASTDVRAWRHTKNQVTATVLSVSDRQFCR